MKSTLLALIALSLPLIGTAQGVWRCGPDGRSYSDTPCADGRPLGVTTEARPTADIHAAQAQAARDIRVAETMRRERLAQEALQRGNGLAALGPQVALGPQAALLRPAKPDRATAKSQTKPRRQLHPEAPGTWRAVAPVSRRTKD